MNSVWHNVKKNRPCPICHHPDWCSVTADGEVCHCMRVESDRAVPSGGWIHFLKSIGEKKQFSNLDYQRDCERRQRERHARAESCRAYFDSLPHSIQGAHPMDDDFQIMLCRNLSRNLGLPEYTFFELDVRWDAAHRAAAFPMRNADGEVTGIRYRVLQNGKKFSMKGSVDGLFFIPSNLRGEIETLHVCEGPTDWAALYACGFINVVGRSSCSCGGDLIASLCRRCHVKRVIIFADNDHDKKREDGTFWNPGLDGAKNLGEYLHLPYCRIIPPAPHNDLRDWYRAGAMTARKVQLLINSATMKVNKND